MEHAHGRAFAEQAEEEQWPEVFAQALVFRHNVADKAASDAIEVEEEATLRRRHAQQQCVRQWRFC